jgi:teichoic acid transport system permease protein
VLRQHRVPNGRLSGERRVTSGEEVTVTRGAEAVPAWHKPPEDYVVVADGAGWAPPTALKSLNGDGDLGYPADDTVTDTMPRIHAEETAIIPRVVEPPEEPPSLADLAQRHGLSRAGTRPGLGSYLADLWRYRQFITTYANGRIVASFGESRLGRLWQLLTPLVNAGVYFLIFGVILGTRGRVPNFIGYLCVGVFVFNFTMLVLAAAVQSISGQLDLVRALQFPRASLPIAMTLVQLQNLIGSIVVLAGIMVATGEVVTTKWLWLVPAMVLESFFNLGLALFVARLGAKVSDLKHLVPYLSRTWMYCSGVLYSAAVFSEHLPRWAAEITHANPLLVYIELARYALMKQPTIASPVPQLWLLGGAWALVMLLFGFIYFWRGESEYGRG